MNVAHIPVLLDEAIAALAIQRNGVYVDATFGSGGHSQRILQALGTRGKLFALDRDPAAVKVAQALAQTQDSLIVREARFSTLASVLAAQKVERIDGLLLDLGVSSRQLDDAARGFSFRKDGPLDMRMNPNQGLSAADWLARADEQQLTWVIAHYGEERFAKSIARAIVSTRSRDPIRTTGQLAALVAKAVRTRERGQDPATRTFQAIRIYLNAELEELSLVLQQSLSLLAAFGRLVVISFHSLEDRLVKQFIHEQAHPAIKLSRLPLPESQLPRPLLRRVGKAIRPSADEIARNPRARSAIMRVAERTEATRVDAIRR